eukprot:gb/GECG01016184.1/.p1 GENE.gb/GECG01016184.1/~~gb/GECG01016184.1/.p1  ORF type:complete len:304 (+),score=48.21 gb/GECG01016184.1/:1-912(+)
MKSSWNDCGPKVWMLNTAMALTLKRTNSPWKQHLNGLWRSKSVRSRIDHLRSSMAQSLTTASQKLDEASSHTHKIDQTHGEGAQSFAVVTSMLRSARGAVDAAKTSLDSIDSTDFSKQVAQHSKAFSQQAHEIQQSSLQDLITKAKGGLESLSRSNTTSRLKDLSTRTQQRVRDGSAFWYGLAKDAYVRGDYTSLLHQTKSSINNVKETTKTSVSEKSRTLFQSSKEKTQEFRSKLGFSRDSGDPNESTKGTYDPFQWLRNAGKTLHRASTSTMREKYLTSKKEAKTDKDGDGTKSDERNSNR